MIQEEYTLILRHDYVDSNGQIHEFEDPIAVKYIRAHDATSFLPPKLLDEMVKQLKTRIIDEVRKKLV